MIADYSDLQIKVQQFLKRNDLSALIPDFIAIAENHFDRNIYTRARRSSFSITPSTTQVSLPSDWGRVIRAYYNGKTLEYFPNDFESGYANGEATRIGYGYQIEGDTLSLSTPQLGQVLRVDYYTIIEPLSDTNPSNWLLEDAADIYLYGTLHEAAVYVRDDARMALWMQKRDAAIQELIDDDKLSRVPEQPLQMRRA
jgi:hypothetical protein